MILATGGRDGCTRWRRTGDSDGRWDRDWRTGRGRRSRNGVIQFTRRRAAAACVQPFLISEAARGEEWVLLDTSGRRSHRSTTRERSWRAGIVARAILEGCKRRDRTHVLLDLRIWSAGTWRRASSDYRFCLEAGLDITKEPIRCLRRRTTRWVDPDEWFGKNECSACMRVASARARECTGERLASNSLLETVVFAKRVVARTSHRRELEPTCPAAPCVLRRTGAG